MAQSKVIRTFHVEMEATVENFVWFARVASNHFNKQWKITSELSENPHAGEIWKDGCGANHVIKERENDLVFTLTDAKGKTWTSQGAYDIPSPFGTYVSLVGALDFENLVERVSTRLDISPGDYWMDRKGNVHHIREIVDCHSDFPVRGMIREYAWTLDGHFMHDREHEHDLIHKVDVCI